VKKSVGKHPKGPSYRRVQPRHRGVNAVLDRKILSLRKRGLWPSEIAPRLRIPVQSVYLRLQELKKVGFMIPRPTSLRPNAHRKVTNEELLAVARSGLSLREVAVKVGIAIPNAHRRLKRLTKPESLQSPRDG
jgi:DNA-binding IclR family transcriptional regulator